MTARKIRTGRVGPRARGGKQFKRAWDFEAFRSVVSRTNRVGLANLSNAELLRACAGVVHYWLDLRPFFIELWSRIEQGQMRYSKDQVAELVGCSRRWIEAIVAGTARKRTKQEAAGNAYHDLGAHGFKAQTNEEFVADIRFYAEKKLQPLLVRGSFGRYGNIYRLLAQYFADAARIEHIDDLDSVSGKEAA